MATWFDLWTTWFNILLARTGHLNLCKLVEGHLTNPTSGSESLKLGSKNRPQLLFKAQKSKSPFYFSEIAFDLGHLNLPSTCQMSHLLSKLSDIPVSATRTSSSEKVCTGLQSWLLGITSREVPGDQVRTCLQSWPPDVTSMVSYYSELPYPVGLGQDWEIPVQWGPMGIPCGQTDMTENITSHNFVGSW